MLILKSSIAYLALYELDPYEFKLFMYIYFESNGIGLQWKRIKQADLEQVCGISHPKVLKSIQFLKDQNADGPSELEPEQRAKMSPEERADMTLHWITQESRTELWSKRQGYGLHEDMNDSERLKELLKPFLEERRMRNRSYYKDGSIWRY